MILVTTTPSVDGYTITNYQGIVFGEVVSGVNMFKDLGAGLRNMFGTPWSAWTSTTRCSAPTTVC